MKVRKAVIPAAGFGTRFLPATKAMPKEMLPVVDKPAIQYIVEEAVNSGIEEILIITGRNKESIENHFDHSPELERMLEDKNKEELLKITQEVSQMVDIHYIRQKEMRGLGHAIGYAKTFVGNEPFAILLGDDIVHNEKPCLKQLIEAYEQYGGSVLGVQQVAMDQVHKYGIADSKHLAGKSYEVFDLVEKPSAEEAPSNIAILGRYVLTPEIFDILEHTPPGKGNEIQLTDGLRTLLKSQKMYAYDFDGIRYDTGDKLGYMKAKVEFALRHPSIGEGFKEYLKDICKTL